MLFNVTFIIFFLINIGLAAAQPLKGKAILALYTGKNDLAHISFVKEANTWFAEVARKNGFDYKSSNEWNKLHADTLARYDLLVFLDSRPDSASHRKAFQAYMQGGGSWMGFHFAGFALTPSQYPQNWDWYHENFLGAGQYVSNTWKPTSAVLEIYTPRHPVTRGIPKRFNSSPNEWYRWENDLRKNPDIKILLAIHPSSFPLGTGPKKHEIWHDGFYPVVWTNKRYHMVYFNMGHNDIDYGGKTNSERSFTFENQIQNQLVLNSLNWLIDAGKQD
jgi:uncharacterized protein